MAPLSALESEEQLLAEHFVNLVSELVSSSHRALELLISDLQLKLEESGRFEKLLFSVERATYIACMEYASCHDAKLL